MRNQKVSMEKNYGETVRGSGSRIVLVPFPATGHMNPMLQLATLLYSRGFSITFFHAPCYLPDSPIFHCFDLVPFPDLPKPTITNELFERMEVINSTCQETVLNYLPQLMKEDDDLARVVCIVSDPLMYCCQSFVGQIKVPQFVLRTSSASSFPASASLPFMRFNGLPIEDFNSEDLVDELNSLRIKDLPRIFNSGNQEGWHKILTKTYNTSIKWSGIILNTVDYLEQPALNEIQKRSNVPMYTIGPLHKHTPSPITMNLLIQDNSCLKWLDEQKPNSVLYVSFGSLAVVNETQFMETAWGLANSKIPFLWVLRPDMVNGSTGIRLPNGFEEAVGQRGRLVKWAPQKEVLAHRAVGGFWTHGGWNSTLESIGEGVPMLCLPCLGDQFVNARIMSHVWKVGIVIEAEYEREEIEKCIKRLMVEKEGEEMKEKIWVLKEEFDKSLEKGGSSYESLNRFMDCILPL